MTRLLKMDIVMTVDEANALSEMLTDMTDKFPDNVNTIQAISLGIKAACDNDDTVNNDMGPYFQWQSGAATRAIRDGTAGK